MGLSLSWWNHKATTVPVSLWICLENIQATYLHTRQNPQYEESEWNTHTQHTQQTKELSAKEVKHEGTKLLFLVSFRKPSDSPSPAPAFRSLVSVPAFAINHQKCVRLELSSGLHHFSLFTVILPSQIPIQSAQSMVSLCSFMNFHLICIRIFLNSPVQDTA